MSPKLPNQRDPVDKVLRRAIGGQFDRTSRTQYVLSGLIFLIESEVGTLLSSIPEGVNICATINWSTRQGAAIRTKRKVGLFGSRIQGMCRHKERRDVSAEHDLALSANRIKPIASASSILSLTLSFISRREVPRVSRTPASFAIRGYWLKPTGDSIASAACSHLEL